MLESVRAQARARDGARNARNERGRERARAPVLAARPERVGARIGWRAARKERAKEIKADAKNVRLASSYSDRRSFEDAAAEGMAATRRFAACFEERLAPEQARASSRGARRGPSRRVL